MRPVEKLRPGDRLLIYPEGSPLRQDHVIQEEYNPHRKAHPPLVANLGEYCSYCETRMEGGENLQVEHVVCVNQDGDLRTMWDNFLLSCGKCNGRDNKGYNPVDLRDVHMPHINNTFKSLVYKEAGVVIVNPELSARGRERASRLLKLTGLDKEDTAKDTRCSARRKVWDIATDMHKRYMEVGSSIIEALMEYISVVGHWSIWFTVFGDCPEVRRELISRFPGTAAGCFDAENGYEPIDRNPLNAEDPT